MYNFYVVLVYLVLFFNLVSLSPHGGIGADINNTKILKFQMPECCKGMKYCFSNESYPIEAVRKALSDITHLTVDHKDKGYPSDEFSHRLGASTGSCGDSRRQLIYYIVDEDDNVRVVVQLEKKFNQEFTIKTDCESENKDIERHFRRSVIKKHNISFESKYMYFDFVVLGNELYSGNYEVEMIKAKLPVCCSCRYIKKY